MPHISIIIPIYNEEECLPHLFEKINREIDTLKDKVSVLVVNDGSVDSSLNLINNFCHQDKKWKAIHLARNFGHQAAISAGLDLVDCDAVILMDGDLQDSPEMIGKLIKKWKEGNDVVYVVRKKRKENFLKRFCYHLFYFLLYKIADIKIPRDSGDFSLMDRKVVDIIKRLPERSRFLRGLRSWVGFKQAGVECERQPRIKGKSKYGIGSLFKLASDGIFSFSWFPLRMLTLVGLLFLCIFSLYTALILYLKFTGEYQLQGWTTLVLLFFAWGGIQLVSLGIIGEYVGRTFHEVKGRPIYIIASQSPN